jgi:hypothetical protein
VCGRREQKVGSTPHATRLAIGLGYCKICISPAGEEYLERS